MPWPRRVEEGEYLNQQLVLQRVGDFVAGKHDVLVLK